MIDIKIPKEWTKTNIENLISENGIFCDGDWIETEDQNPQGDVRLIQLADIGDGYFRDKSNRFLTSQKAGEIGCTCLQKGDILVARMPDPLGRACIFPLDSDRKYVTAVDVCIVRPNTKWLNTKYFTYLINSPRMRAEIESYKSGTTRKRISRKNFGKIMWPIAPVEEQRKISDLIEELFSDLDNAIENLKKAQEQLKIYRQAVLSAAFDGGSSKAGFSRKNWKEMSVDEIGEVITGNTPSKQESSYYGRAYPLYKPGDLDAGFMTIDSVDGLTEKGIEKARMLPAKSILVTCIGATIGKTGLIRRAGASNQQINAIVPKDFMISEYVYYFCVSPKFQEQIKSNASATTLPILNKTKFQRLMLLVPSRDEQVAIVQEIESRFSLCEKLEETIHINLQKAESLRQSILKQAFEGKLTEQWRKKHKDLISGENSAEALLKKIKAEKEALQAKPKGKKKHD